MGEHPVIEDEKVGQFCHYGMSREMISSLPIQNLVANQREAFRKENWVGLAKNHKRSVFYQLNLLHVTEEPAAQNIEQLAPLTEDDQLTKRIGDAMFRSSTLNLRGEAEASAREEARAFGLMREGLIASELHRQRPQLSVYSDQIVWSCSTVRIELAGSCTDTPPLCLSEGGNVINLSVSLEGKAALTQAGFYPDFCKDRYGSLEKVLNAFGSGIEETLVLKQLLTTGRGWQDQFVGILPGVKLLQTKSG